MCALKLTEMNAKENKPVKLSKLSVAAEVEAVIVLISVKEMLGTLAETCLRPITGQTVSILPTSAAYNKGINRDKPRAQHNLPLGLRRCSLVHEGRIPVGQVCQT